MKKINFNNDDSLVLMFAFRYALGRQSTAPSYMVDIIELNWDVLTVQDKKQIQKEIVQYEKIYKLSDIDKPTWWRIVNKEI